MLGLKQGLFSKDNPTSTNWTPLELLTGTDGGSYWWSSAYGIGNDAGDGITHGTAIGTWIPHKHIDNATSRVFIDQSTTGNDFLLDRGYVWSEDSENSKFSLFDTIGGSAAEFSLNGDFFICYRIRFSTLNTGSDALWQDISGTSSNFARIQDADTIRIKIGGGSNRNFDFEGEIATDSWVNIEIWRDGVALNASIDGQEIDPITDTGTVTLDRIFAISDGHLSDFLILKGQLPKSGERVKLRNYLNNLGDNTYDSGALST
tara:strand:+ start:1624 stop:2406 length:783 start_codon:yes stop_codon:yes gene_type:complete